MDYTYQPASVARNGGPLNFLRSLVTGSSGSPNARVAKSQPPGSKNGSTRANRLSERQAGSAPSVNEVVVGKSVIARLGYWLLMRGARVATPSHKWRGSGKKPKVTRSELRQNKVKEAFVSVVAANGRRALVRVSAGEARGFAVAQATDEHSPGVRLHATGLADTSPALVSRAPVSTAPVSTAPVSRAFDKSASVPRQQPDSDGIVAGAKRSKAAKKNSSDHRLKKFEQDLFVKTERNIAAAMKEARRGISAEQLVVKFGLSVPEAGLIVSKCK